MRWRSRRYLKIARVGGWSAEGSGDKRGPVAPRRGGSVQGTAGQGEGVSQAVEQLPLLNDEVVHLSFWRGPNSSLSGRRLIAGAPGRENAPGEARQPPDATPGLPGHDKEGQVLPGRKEGEGGGGSSRKQYLCVLRSLQVSKPVVCVRHVCSRLENLTASQRAKGLH